ncbi:hypothetical protein OG741_13925 [Streptomyces sp. NBC_01410]
MRQGTARTDRCEPAIDDLVWDTSTRRVGQVMDHVGSRWLLRPAGGGCEWEADAEGLRPATPSERLTFGVTQANARSTGGLL